MWDKILKYLNDNKDALNFLFGSGIVLAALGGIFTFVRWLINEYRLRRIRTNESVPFKIIPPNSNAAKEILGGADDDALADRNIPYHQRTQGTDTSRELEALIDDNRWILIVGRTGLEKTREAVQLAQNLNNKGWTILLLTREAWLDAPARLPNNVPERKLLFFLDDLNKKCLSSKAEIHPSASHSLTLPITEPFQTRLARTLNAFDSFCGKSEIRVIATARNETTTEFDEPSEWDKLGWLKYRHLWKNFKLIDLSEPDEESEQKLLTDIAERADVYIHSDEVLSLVRRNDGTFRNLIENVSSAKMEGFILASENFRDTLKGTWKRRYQKAIQIHPEARYIYDAIELIQKSGLNIRFSTVIQIASILSAATPLKQIMYRWKYLFALKLLIKNENVLHPRDGQIEGKGYRVNTENYLHLVYKQVYLNAVWNYQSLGSRIFGILEYFFLGIIPTSVFTSSRKFSYIERLAFSILTFDSTIYDVGKAYLELGHNNIAEQFFLKSLNIETANPFNRIFFKRSIAESWNILGVTLNRLNRSAEAIQAYQKSIEMDPKNKYAWVNLGNIYSDLDRNEDAIQAYQKSIEIDTKFAPPLIKLGYVYGILKHYDEAIQAFQKAIEIDQKDAANWSDLATVYSLQKDFEKSLNAYQKAVEIEPESGALHSSLVRILRNLGKEKEAQEELEAARLLMKSEPEYSRACLESICGNTDEALRLLKIAIELKQVPLSWAKQDPDFDFIRDDARFKELVGLV